MATGGAPDSLPRHKLDVKWFTEGEFLWRTGASIAWLIICLPAALLIFYGIATIDILHPISWVSGVVSVIFEAHFWIALIFFALVNGFLAVSKIKFNSVQDVVHYSRASSMLFLLHPARLSHMLFHIPCGMLAVWILTWMLPEPFSSLTTVKPDSEDECYLNEYSVFLVTFGGWLGFYSSLQYFLNKEFHFTFPKIQQKKFFLVKAAVWPCIYKAVTVSLRACRWYYVLYFIAGNIPRDCFGSFLVAPVNSNTVPLNSVSGLIDAHMLWVVLSVGTLLSFVWIFGNNLFVIYNTQAYTFSIESAIATEKNQCLPAVIGDKTMPLLRYLAFLDLCQLSQFSSRKRKQIFCLSQPGGRPVNWTSISEECVSLLDNLTSDITTHVDYQMHLQQFTTENRSFTATPSNGQKRDLMPPLIASPVVGTPHGTPLTASRRPKLWSALKDNERTPSHSPLVTREVNGNIMSVERIRQEKQEREKNKWRIQMIPHHIVCFFKERPVVKLLFHELPEYRKKALFSGCQLHIWALEGLSRLAAASFKEDTFGVVQKTLPDILSSLLALLQALDRYAKFPSAGVKSMIQPRPPRPQGTECMRYHLRSTLTSSIYRITNTFREHLYGIPLTQEHRNRLQAFMEFKE